MWRAALYAEVDKMIQEAEAQMEPPVKAFWNRISIVPQKWHLSPWGDEGGGFWVVSLLGQECLYYNDIEDGFNFSRFETPGIIGEYGCEQRELYHCVFSCYESFTQAIASAV